MTDQEIIKALECCANELGCDKCPANPYRGNYGFCTAPLIKSAFDLITRQQAEIKDEKAKVDICAEVIKRQDIEIERLKKNCADIDKFARDICKKRMLKGKAIADFEDLQEYIKEQRAEAVREFAEKLKANARKGAWEVREYIEPDDIDNLVEEMEGEQ